MSMPADQQSLDFQISREDWAPIQALLEEVQEQERQEHFVAALYQWDLIVRLFRRIERERLIDRPPTKTDLRYHKFLLHTLLGIGNFLEIQAARTPSDELKKNFGIRREDLAAYLRELEDTYNEWHGEIEPRRLEDLKAAIFSVKA